ncbi:MAG: hypothetical protein WC405_19790 [Syntrophales bacterium]
MKIGTLVAVWMGNREVLITTTQSEVFEMTRPANDGFGPLNMNLRGDRAVMVKGRQNSYPVELVRPIIGSNIHHSAIMALGAAVAGEV